SVLSVAVHVRQAFECFQASPPDVGRNGQSNPLRWNTLRGERHLCRTDPDQSPRDIDYGTSAVTRINRGIGLHEILVIDVVYRDVALGRAQHATADRTTVTDGVTNHDYGLA